MEKRPVRYILVGITVTVFNYLFYTLLSNLILRDENLFWLSSAISTITSTIIAYFLHSKVTWREKPNKISALKFFVWNGAIAFPITPTLTYLFGLCSSLYDFVFNISTNIGLPFDYIFVESTSIFILTSIVTMIINYLFYHKFVFKS